MKKLAVLICVLVILVAGMGAMAFAQGDFASSLLGEIVVHVEQAVPVDLTIATETENGDVITVTVPVTVETRLAVTISGDQVINVTSGEASEATIIAETIPASEELIDNVGLPYALEVNDKVELVQLATSKDGLGDIRIIGELRNLDDEPLERARITVTLYGQDGEMLAVGNGSLANSEIAPGESGPFTTFLSVDFDDVGSYRLQIE